MMFINICQSISAILDKDLDKDETYQEVELDIDLKTSLDFNRQVVRSFRRSGQKFNPEEDCPQDVEGEPLLFE